MGESYVRPVTRAREPKPTWIAVWRFRLAALIVLALAAYAVVWVYNWANGATRQDPSFEGSRPAVTRVAGNSPSGAGQ